MQFQPHNHTTHNPPTPNFYSPNGVACAPEFLDRHTTCSGPNSRRGVLSRRTTEGHSHKGRNGNVGWMWVGVGGVGLGWVPCLISPCDACCSRRPAFDFPLRLTFHLAVASSFVTNSDWLSELYTVIIIIVCLSTLLLLLVITVLTPLSGGLYLMINYCRQIIKCC